MTTTLITGANKGLGYEAARQLVAAGHDVWVGARDEGRGKQAAADLGARFVAIDVTSDDSVAAAVATVEAEAGVLDVLVNNAGISRGAVEPGELALDDLQAVFDTNVFGVVRVTNAFLPLLQRSSAPVIVNVSSGLGSLTLAGERDTLAGGFPGGDYPASKSALNMLTVRYANAYPSFRVNAVDPGFTATDLNQHRGTQTVEEGTEAIVAMAQMGADGPTGTFVNRDGVVPW
jgi:NAD(P)-dependent dehydrogenase (short-subunit alcohol dehydrogenase family)